MNVKGYYQPIDLSYNFLNNINENVRQNKNEEIFNSFENKKLYPPFRINNIDINFSSSAPEKLYRTKSIYSGYIDKPSQTEHDEIGINTGFLDNYYGYINYGNYNYQNQEFKESLKHKKTPKNNLDKLL